MRRHRWSWWLACVMVAGGYWAPPVAAAGTDEPGFIAMVPTEATEMALTDGAMVGWTIQGFSPAGDVFFLNLADGRLAQQKLDPPGQMARRVLGFDRGRVAWLALHRGQADEPHELWVLDFKTGQRRRVALWRDGATTEATIAGDWLFWLERDLAGDTILLRRMNLATGGEATTVANMSVGQDTSFALAASERFAVVRSSVFQNRTNQWTARAIDLMSGRQWTFASGGMYVLPISVGGDVAIVNLVAYDLATGEQQTLSSPSWPVFPTTDGRLAFWTVVEREADGRERRDLVGRDLVTGRDLVVQRDIWSDARPMVRGGILAWIGGNQPSRGVYLRRTAELFGEAEPPPPPPRRDFAETGRALRGPFLDFWERHGGQVVFGLPLTDQLVERSANDGQAYLAQYVERQRFEYHPELAGTPYSILLGRLGAEEAMGRDDLRGLWAFNPIPLDAEHPPGCVYLAEARHRLCGEFRPHWEGHGLDLGDEGVSFAESLALFGYPISEEFIDPRTGLITQYFERARFEYHPSLPSGRRVLLGRLGTVRACGLINRSYRPAPGCQ